MIALGIAKAWRNASFSYGISLRFRAYARLMMRRYAHLWRTATSLPGATRVTKANEPLPAGVRKYADTSCTVSSATAGRDRRDFALPGNTSRNGHGKPPAG